jgi:chloride channel 3/4/5
VSLNDKMPQDAEAATERTALIYHVANDRRLSQLQHEHDAEASSLIASSVTKEEQQMAGSSIGERLPYNDYTTIDWLHDLVGLAMSTSRRLTERV